MHWGLTRGFRITILSLLVTTATYGAEPRFYAVRGSITSADDTLVGYNADGQLISEVDFHEDLNPWRLLTNGSDLLTYSGSTIHRRAINGTGGFEPFVPASGESAQYFHVDSRGHVYVPSSTSRSEFLVWHYDEQGQFLEQQTLAVPDVPTGIGVDRSERLFVIQNHPGRVRQYSPSGTFQHELDLTFFSSWNAEIDDLNGRLYAADHRGGVAVVDISGSQPQWIDYWPIPGIDLLIDISLDALTGHILAAGLGGVFDVDADGATLVRNEDPNFYFTGVVGLPGPNGTGADLNGDGDLDPVDLDAMVRAIVGGSQNLAFDLSGDGQVTLADQDAWLNEAANQNLPPGQTYSMGDANLDGIVDGEDFGIWNNHKFTRLAAWSKGDFNGDGSVDGEDFIIWNANKTILAATPRPVPEPQGWVAMLLTTLLWCNSRRWPGC